MEELAWEGGGEGEGDRREERRGEEGEGGEEREGEGRGGEEREGEGRGGEEREGEGRGGEEREGEGRGGEERGVEVSHSTHLLIYVDILNLMQSRKARQLIVMHCRFAFV